VAARLSLHMRHRSTRPRTIICGPRARPLHAQRCDPRIFPRATLFACLWLGLSTAAVAQPAVELAPASANVTEHQIKLGVPALSAELWLRNSSKDAVRYYRPGTLLTRSGDSAGRPTAWKRITPPTDDNSIAAGAQIALELSAELPDVGVYETFIDTYGKDDKGAEVPDRRIRVLVTREADAVPSELMVDPKPAAETWPWNWGDRIYLLTLRNTSTKRLAFATPNVISFTRKSGDDQTSVGTSETPSLDSASCGTALEPNKSCPIRLNLQNVLRPGEYMIDVGVAGVGGGWSQRTQNIRVRASAWLAFLIVIAGAGAGWYVQTWRTKGRRAVGALIDVTRLREAAARLMERADDDLKALIRRALEEIDDIEARLRKDVDATADIERVRLWVRHLTATTEILERIGKLSADGQSVLRARRDAVMHGVANSSPTEVEQTALETLIRALGEDLSTWPRLAQSIDRANDLLAAMDALLSAAEQQTNIAELQATRDSLDQAINTAKASLPAHPNGSLSDRIDPLDQAIASAEQQANAAARKLADQLFASKKQEFDGLAAGDAKTRFKEFLDAVAGWKADTSGKPVSARLRDLAGLFLLAGGKEEAATPVIAPPVPTFDVPIQALIPGWGSSLTNLQASLKRNELLTNAFILIAAGLSGVLTLWVPNSTWGSVGDLIGAFLAGLAARVVVGEVGSANQATGVVKL
jgi:hypothetical protein